MSLTATQLDVDRLQALAGVTMIPGIGSKRFVRDMQSVEVGAPLSEKQQQFITSLAWRYRRQMPASLVPAANPENQLEKARAV
jgi:hypothetical protein